MWICSTKRTSKEKPFKTLQKLHKFQLSSGNQHRGSTTRQQKATPTFFLKESLRTKHDVQVHCVPGHRNIPATRDRNYKETREELSKQFS